MAYESNVCTSSLGAFSTLWGFHRVCYRQFKPGSTDILYITNNLASGTTSATCRKDLTTNLQIVKRMYYTVIMAICHTYGMSIIPPSLRSDDFLSYFCGTNND